MWSKPSWQHCKLFWIPRNTCLKGEAPAPYIIFCKHLLSMCRVSTLPHTLSVSVLGILVTYTYHILRSLYHRINTYTHPPPPPPPKPPPPLFPPPPKLHHHRMRERRDCQFNIWIYNGWRFVHAHLISHLAKLKANPKKICKDLYHKSYVQRLLNYLFEYPKFGCGRLGSSLG